MPQRQDSAPTSNTPAPNLPIPPRPVVVSSDASSSDVSGLFPRAIEPISVGPAYQLGLVLVALLMLVFPVLYIGLIAALGWGVWWHATTNYALLGRSFGGAVLYVGGCLLGLSIILSLVKPLFAPRARRPEPVSLDERAQPMLYAFVRRLCETVGAPVPKQIEVDVDVNASAGFRRGLLSFFGHDLTLVIGLPLAASMSLREFSGVLAHEFGHFSQGSAMRLSYLIRRVNDWLIRIAYGRDRWDEWLSSAIERHSGLWMITIWPSLGFFVSKLVCRVFVHAAHALSCFLSRQMEHDADAHEISVAGTSTFTRTSRELWMLNGAAMRAYADMQDWWAERRLPDDIPQLIAGTRKRLPKDVEKELLEGIEKEPKGLFRTHPTTKERIARGEELNDDGVMSGGDQPASAIFKEFDELCRQATYNVHRLRMGEAMYETTFVPTASILKEQAAHDKAYQGLDELFNRELINLRPVFPDLGFIEPPKDPSACAKSFLQLGRRLSRDRDALTEHIQPYIELDRRCVHLRTARTLSKANVSFSPSSLDLTKPDLKNLDERVSESEERLRHKGSMFMHYERHTGEYLELGLRLLAVPAMGKKLPDIARHRDQMNDLLGVLTAVKDSRRIVESMEEELHRLQHLFAYFDANKEEPAYFNRVRRTAESLHRNAISLRNHFSALEYPFPHQREHLKTSEYLVDVIPPLEELPHLCMTAESMLDKHRSLYWRSLGLVVAVARQIEKRLIKDAKRKQAAAGAKG